MNTMRVGRYVFITVFVLCAMVVKAQTEIYPLGKLLQPNEELVMAFRTKNKKIITVNTDKNRNYIVFRYGDKDSVKFQFPQELNENSWKQFGYYSHKQSGEKINPDIEKYRLSFFYNGIRYTIDQNRHVPTEDEELELNITGIVDGCLLSAKPRTRIGSLDKLDATPISKDITSGE